VEAFQGWLIEARSASTAVDKHKGLQQFFKWLPVDEQAIDRTAKVLDACRGKGFLNLRDGTLIGCTPAPAPGCPRWVW
jgi:hypothetical protein